MDQDQRAKIQALRDAVAPTFIDGAFDPFLNIPPEKQAGLAARLIPILNSSRDRSYRQRDADNAAHVIGCVIANAIVAMEAPAPSRVHYSRDKNEYALQGPYKPHWLASKLLLRVVDDLAGLGLLGGTRAPPGPDTVARSTFNATTKLATILAEVGVSGTDVRANVEARPVIYLNNKKKKLVSYDVSDPTIKAMSDSVRSYNTFLDQHDITLSSAAGSVPALDLSKKHLSRIFNRGSFSKGGRYYGGWWIAQPSEVRKHILIDGEATVELDYASFVPRALYHLDGLECPFDPYETPNLKLAFKLAGYEWEVARPLIKAVFFLMLNAKGRQGLHNSEPAKALPSDIPLQSVITELENHNALIKHHFFSEYGLDLMYQESEICSLILLDGIRRDNVILPVHDSFITKESNKEWMLSVMMNRYYERYHHYPVVV